MTREEQVMNEAEAQKVFGPDAYVGFLNGVRWADEHPKYPWRPVIVMPSNKWVWCVSKTDPDHPFLARLDEESGECFNLEMELVFPDYWMEMPKLPKED